MHYWFKKKIGSTPDELKIELRTSTSDTSDNSNTCEQLLPERNMEREAKNIAKKLTESWTSNVKGRRT